MITLICGMTPEAEHVLQEDVGVAGQAVDALLDARAAGVEEADDRRAVAHRHLLHLDDLLGVRLGKRSAEDREILGENVDHAAVDRAPAGHHAVARDALLLPCRSRGCGARRTCRTPRTSPRRAAGRAARGRSACPWRAGRRSAARRRRPWPARAAARAPRGCASSALPHSFNENWRARRSGAGRGGKFTPRRRLKRREPRAQHHRLLRHGVGAGGGFGVDAPALFLEGLVEAGELEGRLGGQLAAAQREGEDRRAEQRGGGGQAGQREVVLRARPAPRSGPGSAGGCGWWTMPWVRWNRDAQRRLAPSRSPAPQRRSWRSTRLARPVGEVAEQVRRRRSWRPARRRRPARPRRPAPARPRRGRVAGMVAGSGCPRPAPPTRRRPAAPAPRSAGPAAAPCGERGVRPSRRTAKPPSAGATSAVGVEAPACARRNGLAATSLRKASRA